LSERAIVLFHDTNVRERGFGVFKLWAELAADFPAFEFFHGHGVGVLGHGAELPNEMAAFFAATNDPRVATEVRQAYGSLGAALQADSEARQAQARLTARAAELKAELEEREKEVKNVAAKCLPSICSKSIEALGKWERASSKVERTSREKEA
jgi:hypothetical protein